MAILDVFKKKKREKKVKEEVGEVKKPPKVKVEQKAKKLEKKEKKEKKVKKVAQVPYQVLKEPHISEKATALAQQNQYVFKVYPRTNKIEIKKAVQALYGVDVISVKIIKIPKRRRRLGKISGWRKGYKKAIIKIKEGQKIEVLPT